MKLFFYAVTLCVCTSFLQPVIAWAEDQGFVPSQQSRMIFFNATMPDPDPVLINDSNFELEPLVCADTERVAGKITQEDAAIIAAARCRSRLLAIAGRSIARDPLIKEIWPEGIKNVGYQSLAQALFQIRMIERTSALDNHGNKVAAVRVEMKPLFADLQDALKSGVADADYQNILYIAFKREQEALNIIDGSLYGAIKSNPKNETKLTVKTGINILRSLELFRQINRSKHTLNPVAAEEVESAMHDAVNLDPLNPVLFYLLGEAQLNQGKGAQCIATQSHTLELAPDFSAAFLSRGTAYLHLHLTDLAIADYNKAIELAPDNPSYYMSRGAAFLVKEDFKGMCKDFERACADGECDGLHWATSRGHCK